jgi:hypothetical protein
MQLDHFSRGIWAIDCEFTARPGERPIPLCVVGKEVESGSEIRQWLGEAVPPCPPYPTTPEALCLGYYSSAEWGCHLALGWSLPSRVIDLYAEFRHLAAGRAVPCGYSLLGALTAFGLPTIGAEDKTSMRQLALRGGPYSSGERAALLDYCASDVDALVRLFRALRPHIDVPRAVLRGRFMCAAARIEWVGIPVDAEMLGRVQRSWDRIRRQIAHQINVTHPVFVPTGQRTLTSDTPFGHAVLRTAQARGVDPYDLAQMVEYLWQERVAAVRDVLRARRDARRRTGLTVGRMSRWEAAGRDSASWPGLDDQARDVAQLLPELGLGQGAFWEVEPPYAEDLWEMLRVPEDLLPARDSPHLLEEAAARLLDSPPTAYEEMPLSFSAARFEAYLAGQGIAWPRLESGALALDDDTFRQQARAYPAAIGPIREVRHALAQLRLTALTVGADGRNRYLLSAFGSRTGRNSPSARASIFGPACWIRSLIKPGPGRAVAYIDWVQQELAIAAYLSHDLAMQQAYTSGDFYLTFAQMAGAAPPDATKDSHGAVRELYKTIALGVMYGLTEQGSPAG